MSEPRWIPVSERLPEDGESVLCWADDGDFCGYEVVNEHNGFFTGFTHDLLPITHWMPLPPPPAQGDK